MTNGVYVGPRVVERRGRGMGGWIWVAPGDPPPPPAVAVAVQTPMPEETLVLSTTSDGMDYASAPDREGETSRAADIESVSPGAPNSHGIRIGVLGPVQVEPVLPAARRSVLLELACFLVLHRQRPVSTEELQIALSSNGEDGPETSAKSVRNYASELRSWLGAEHVPSARGSGYRFSDSVTCDWGEFQSLAEKTSDDPDDELASLSNALNLVRGRPFAGLNYKWVDAELLVSAMEVAISDVARRLAAIVDDEHGGPAYRWFAGTRALLACPYDLGLWEMALEGAAGYDPDELVRTWQKARVTLGDDIAALHDVAGRLGLS